MAGRSGYDYVIVGAGSAGCVMANRLSADPTIRVLLLEAGGKDTSLYIHMPASASIASRDPRLTWGYETEPEPNLDERSIAEIRGRVLAGPRPSMAWWPIAATPATTTAGPAKVCRSGALPICLAYFRKMETFDGGANDYRGGDGPQHIETCAADNPWIRLLSRPGPRRVIRSPKIRMDASTKVFMSPRSSPVTGCDGAPPPGI